MRTFDYEDAFDLDSFQRQASEFLDKAATLNEAWELRRYSDDDDFSVYLFKREEREWDEDDDDDDDVEDDDENDRDSHFVDTASIAFDHSRDVLSFEYHVLFSASYRVPTLFFKASRRNGKPISLEELWRLIAKDHSGIVDSDDKWKFVTQQEHPFLGTPFFHVHPCRTADALRDVRRGATKSVSYLSTWLSMYGPVVGMRLPVALFA